MDIAPAAPHEAVPADEERVPIRAWYAILIMSVAAIFGFVNRQILILVVEPLKHDLGLQDFGIGAIQGLGPALFAVLAGFPIAWLADKVDRKILFMGCILFWSLATAACGLAQNFEQLFIATIGIALGEAGIGPIVYSLIPDLFPGRSRIRANLAFYGLSVMGVGVGLMIGGWALEFVEQIRPLLPEMLRDLAGWRLTFFLVALPGIPIALALLPIPSPKARIVKAGQQAIGGIGDYLKRHGGTFARINAAGGLYAFALGATGVWLPIAIIRSTGASASEVGLKFGFTYTVAAAAGVITAMAVTPLWRRFAGEHFVPRALAVCNLAAIFPTLAFLLITTPDTAYILGGIQYFIIIIGAAYSPTMLQEIAPAQLRARVIAVATIIFTIIATLGPMVVGAVSDKFGHDPRSALVALVVVTVPALAASVFLYLSINRRFPAMLRDVAEDSDDHCDAVVDSGAVQKKVRTPPTIR